MEQFPRQGGKTPLKKRRSSPLPEALGSRAGSSQPCRRRLFGSAAPRSAAEPGRLKRKPNVKSLPKIKENSEITQVMQAHSQSSKVNVQGETDLEIKKVEESTVQIKGSLLINFESKESLRSTEVTSSTGMTLPTGVSTFLLECLDTDSTEEYITGPSTSLRSLSSPEMFRDDGSERSNFCPVDSGKYKNSTLLDSSKAVAIDEMPHISNLSTILEPVVEDFPDKYSRRKKLSRCNYTSSLSVSTTVAGKKVCKITAARERTPNLKTGMHRSSPLGPERKPDNQTAKPKRLISKVKGKQFSTSEEGTSSLQLHGAPGNTSARAVRWAAEALPCEQTGAVGQTSSTMLVMEKKKALQKSWLCSACRAKSVCPLNPNKSFFMAQSNSGCANTTVETAQQNRWLLFLCGQCSDGGVAELVSSVQSLTWGQPIPEYHSLRVAEKKSAPLSDCHHPRGFLGFTQFQLTPKHSAFPKGCLKITLQVLKIGSTVSPDEISGFQQESREEIAVLLLWQEGETDLPTSN